MNEQTPIAILQDEWSDVVKEILAQEGPRAIMGSVSKREKGWTYRRGFAGPDVWVDFWNDGAKAMFLLSYSHLIENSLKMQSKNGCDRPKLRV